MPPEKDYFTINLGDMFQLWSNGKFKSTLHRVVTTRNVHRYSTPFFVHPSHDTVVRAPQYHPSALKFSIISRRCFHGRCHSCQRPHIHLVT